MIGDETKTGISGPSADAVVKDRRQRTRKQHSAEEKIHIVLDGRRGEESISTRGAVAAAAAMRARRPIHGEDRGRRALALAVRLVPMRRRPFASGGIILCRHVPKHGAVEHCVRR